MQDLTYKNYIFDFYGTLVDILTDEEDLAIWQQLTSLYAAYGADYTPYGLRQKYLDLIKAEEERLHEQTVYKHVEIDLVAIFIKLLTDAEKTHPTENYIKDMESWGNLIANVFRINSRKVLKAYPNTLKTLQTIKDKGGKIFILSNAQRAFTQPEIELTGCADLVDKIYISSDFKMKKPQPDFMYHLLEENHLDIADCVMVGNDFTSDMLVASAVGMDGILLNTFPYSSEEIAKLNTMNAKVIDDIAELLDYITD